ncbi:MAG: hypothetical protein KC448_07820 [Yoonia sp.]|nr:hypothetical protein [Yoonia sp.]
MKHKKMSREAAERALRTEAFFAVFGQYNQAIWPMTIAVYLLGAIVVDLLLRCSACRLVRH